MVAPGRIAVDLQDSFCSPWPTRSHDRDARGTWSTASKSSG